jgi:MFS family permease
MFLPMTVLMIAASLLAGRWTVRAGPRWSITAGCMLFAAGLVLAAGLLAFITLRSRPASGILTVCRDRAIEMMDSRRVPDRSR